ncbi:hypothetical protein BGZ97_005446 [Linnemannia gamsii]|uniref:Uncharacterized protein n=1 Tax=Linnemannia gamsii TaxID=64522 RepID=A0A9P6QUH2_9FUNG|nr:hypothetical protein BGZ97_005446 [Linnemannia gamsii]
MEASWGDEDPTQMDEGGIMYAWAPEDFDEGDYDIDDVPAPDWEDDGEGTMQSQSMLPFDEDEDTDLKEKMSQLRSALITFGAM